MQERHLPQREERFHTLAWLVRQMRRPVRRVLDLGCGTASVMRRFLEAFPAAAVVGIDMDFTLLPLAAQRLTPFGDRAVLVEADLRGPTWPETIGGPFDAIVSATALHWLSADELSDLYRRLPEALEPGGVFLNADHVGSESPALQRAWEARRDESTRSTSKLEAETYDRFWEAYLGVLPAGARVKRRGLHEPYSGVEAGMPLTWHLDQLRENGFGAVDCFWRLNNDAIYGGILGERRHI